MNWKPLALGIGLGLVAVAIVFRVGFVKKIVVGA